MIVEQADELRKIMNQRLDLLLASRLPAALEGDDRALASVLAIHDRQIRLNAGVEAPLPAGGSTEGNGGGSKAVIFIGGDKAEWITNAKAARAVLEQGNGDGH